MYIKGGLSPNQQEGDRQYNNDRKKRCKFDEFAALLILN